MRPAGADTRRMMLSALTDLPQPDSPTSATVSPARTSHDTPSTARTTPPEVVKWVWRFSTFSRTSIDTRVYNTVDRSLARGLLLESALTQSNTGDRRSTC